MNGVFGKAIRAMRHGFREVKAGSTGHSVLYLRISEVKSGMWLTELCPIKHFPKSVRKVKEHVCWWDDPGVINESEPLREAILLAHGRMVELLLDDDGEVTK